MPPRGKCLSAAASSGTLVQRTHLFVRTHKCVVFPSVRTACGSCWAHAWFMLCLYYTRAQSSGFEKEIKLQHFHCFIVRAGQISPTRHPMRRGLRRRPLGKEAPLCAPLDAYVAFAAFSHRSAKSHGRVGFSLFVQAFVCAGNNGICVENTQKMPSRDTRVVLDCNHFAWTITLHHRKIHFHLQRAFRHRKPHLYFEATVEV